MMLLTAKCSSLFDNQVKGVNVAMGYNKNVAQYISDARYTHLVS